MLGFAGEAQQIDRIMEKFAERYCRDNPGAFGSADGAYLLSFAIIMLNTDAHNPMADAHMSRDDFVMMCQSQVRHTYLPKTRFPCIALVNHQVHTYQKTRIITNRPRDCVYIFASAMWRGWHQSPHLCLSRTVSTFHTVHESHSTRRCAQTPTYRSRGVQSEDGGFEPILPAADLEAIHGRILAKELALKEDNGAAEQQSTPSQQQRGGGGPPLNIRLAAALGLTPLLLPFR